jgi:chemotaxis family two-component system response regulator Rcp1
MLKPKQVCSMSDPYFPALIDTPQPGALDLAQSSSTPIDILLVEDHPGDARLTQEAFRSCTREIRLHHSWDGIEALSFLRQEGIHLDAPRPSVILLDLNMHKMGGLETLALIKGDESLAAIPVIVLTTSDNEADVYACYRLGANCYLRKPAEWDGFQALMEKTETFWFTLAKLPAIDSPTHSLNFGAD